jgi:hypothetical protein
MTERPLLFLAEITVYDPSIAGTRVLRYSTGKGFVTSPSESPPNTYYEARIDQPALIRRSLFRPGSTMGRTSVAYGDLILRNEDGGLDALIDYGFDGREIIIRQGLEGAAYPSGFRTVLAGTMEQAEPDLDVIRIKLRDRMQELAVELQPTKYAGDNVLPDGLEGTADDLLGKSKPRCFGVVTNVAPPCVNTSKLIYQVNDGPLASVDDVYDRGIGLTPAWAFSGVTNASGGHAFAYGAGLLVSIGAGGIYSSPDGSTWTLRQAIGGSMYGIRFRNGMFVTVGGSGNAYTSPDGLAWTSRTSGFGLRDCFDVTWGNPGGTGNGIWVIVGGMDNGVNIQVSTSTDNGATWSLVTLPTLLGEYLYAIEYGNGLFVTGGVGQPIGTDPTQRPRLVTSSDATTWVTSTSVFTPISQIIGITYGSAFVLVDDNGSSWSSPAAIGWIQETLPSGFNAGGGSGQGNCLSYINTFYVVGGQGPASAAMLAVGTDGASWGLLDLGVTNSAVGVGTNGTVITALTRVGSGGSYATEEDLLDDDQAPPPGMFRAFLDAGYFRLGATPAGQVTADATEGASAADRTAGQVFTRLLWTPLATPLLEWDPDDIAALDAAIAAVLGFWSGTEEMTVADAVDLVAASVGAWWGPDAEGVFRIVQFVEPSGTPDIQLNANDLLQMLDRVTPSDPGNGIPTYRTTVRWGRNYTVQGSDLATGVTAERRAFLAAEWREASETDTDVQTAHLLAPSIVEDSLLAEESDAQAEATRRQALRGVRRDTFQTAIDLNDDTLGLDLDNVANLTHARYGLSAGDLFKVLDLEPDAVNRKLALTLWR